jgi:hypothetical protein
LFICMIFAISITCTKNFDSSWSLLLYM